MAVIESETSVNNERRKESIGWTCGWQLLSNNLERARTISISALSPRTGEDERGPDDWDVSASLLLDITGSLRDATVS